MRWGGEFKEKFGGAKWEKKEKEFFFFFQVE